MLWANAWTSGSPSDETRVTTRTPNHGDPTCKRGKDVLAKQMGSLPTEHVSVDSPNSGTAKVHRPDG